jgi:hypothetical protein
MSASNPNVSVCQSICCCTGDGGAGGLSSAINAVGRWGTILLATGQGKPIVSGNTRVGAKGSATVPEQRMSGGSLILILAIVAVFIFLLRK